MLPPGGASPVRTATGASTGGVRMPPRAMPRSSRTMASPATSSGGAPGGASPSTTQVRSPATAARSTSAWGPSLIEPHRAARSKPPPPTSLAISAL